MGSGLQRGFSIRLTDFSQRDRNISRVFGVRFASFE
jgi:hypothetical protein